MGFPGYLAPLVVPAWVFPRETPESKRRRDAASFRPGDGLSVVGTPNAQARFAKMVRREMRRSPAFHELMLKINADKANPVTLTLSWKDSKVRVDSFASRKYAVGHQEIDLADLEQFPLDPPADHPNAITRGEILMHAMAEAHAGSLGHKDFDTAHEFAITAQNTIRAERGQEGRRVPGKERVRSEDGVVEMDYDNGYSEEWIPNRGDPLSIGRIDRFEPR
jgi:hypothetical protein